MKINWKNVSLAGGIGLLVGWLISEKKYSKELEEALEIREELLDKSLKQFDEMTDILCNTIDEMNSETEKSIEAHKKRIKELRGEEEL